MAGWYVKKSAVIWQKKKTLKLAQLLRQCNVTSSSNALQWIFKYMYAPDILLFTGGWRNSALYLVIVGMEDKTTIDVMPFQSCKILLHSIINCCAASWRLIRLQTHESITQTGPPGSYFTFSPYLKQHTTILCVFSVWTPTKRGKELCYLMSIWLI